MFFSTKKKQNYIVLYFFMYISYAGIIQKKQQKNEKKKQHGNASEWARNAQGRLLLGYRGPVRCPGHARDIRSSPPSSSWHYEASNSKAEHPGWTGPIMTRIMDFHKIPQKSMEIMFFQGFSRIFEPKRAKPENSGFYGYVWSGLKG